MKKTKKKGREETKEIKVLHSSNLSGKRLVPTRYLPNLITRKTFDTGFPYTVRIRSVDFKTEKDISKVDICLSVPVLPLMRMFSFRRRS